MYLDPSQRGGGTKSTVDPVKRHCTCRDQEDWAIECKPMFAVEFVQTRENAPGGAATVTRTFAVSESESGMVPGRGSKAVLARKAVGSGYGVGREVGGAKV